jgi:hypothetical protein
LCEIYGCSEAGQLALRRTAQTLLWQTLDGVALRQDAAGTWAFSTPHPGPVETPTLLGDVIELREPGRFLLQGRLADLVNVAGKRTSLAYLTHQLNAIPGVADGVFVMPEASSGDAVARPMALVVAPGLTPQAILAELRRHIDAAFLPRPLLIVGALPRNLVGKLPREAILRLAAEAQAAGSVERHFPLDHPTAAGHFPGDPIIPAATLLDEIVGAIAARRGERGLACEIRSAKFHRPVRPGDRVSIGWETGKTGELRFECRLADTALPALTGTLRIGSEPP